VVILDYSVTAIIHASVLSLSLSLDALAASFAYGCSGTRIPVKSTVVITLVCTFILALALYAGSYASNFIPAHAGAWICFSVLLLIGGIKLYQSLTAKPADCLPEGERGLSVRVLKPGQAVIIATALSIDGLAAGFGAALGGVNALVMLGVSLAAHMAAVPLGARLGRSLSDKSRLDVSWIGGVVIIILAFSKLL
jgi:putative Mn2+ efflux pump MntP